MDVRTLQYWHKLEHFHPYIMREPDDDNIKTWHIHHGDRFPLFANPQASGVPEKKEVRFYVVHLGIFKVGKALNVLEKRLGQPMAFSDTGDDASCFCRFRLDEKGRFVGDNFQVSSFPWAIHRVARGGIDMDKWDEDFQDFQKRLYATLFDHIEPVSCDFLAGTRDFFAGLLSWNPDFEPSWARIDAVLRDRPEPGWERENGAGALGGARSQAVAETSGIVGTQGAGEGEENHRDNPDDPNSSAGQREERQNQDGALPLEKNIEEHNLLNSFYVRDLERVIDHVKRGGGLSAAFCAYTEAAGEKRSGVFINIEKNAVAAYELMSPERLPCGRWPNQYGLRFMQQLNVNAFLDQEQYSQELFSVNGPPGTGKTTLLKDVAAALVVKRAAGLAKLGLPDDAFTGKRISVKDSGSRFTNRVRDLKPELKEFGMLVASNNNGAVENITKSLPQKDELPDEYQEASYFKEVSDLMLYPKQGWGLCAAALGNSRNRRRFIDAFWPIRPKEVVKRPEQMAMGQLLGDEAAAIDLNYDFNKELSQMVKQVSREEWTEAKKEFRAALKAVKDEYKLMMEQYEAVMEIQQLGRDLKDCEPGPEQRRMEKRIRALRDKQGRFKRQNKLPLTVEEYFVQYGREEEGLWAKSSPWGYDKLNKLREALFLKALALHQAFVCNSPQLRDNLDGFGKWMRGMIPASQVKEAAPVLLQSFFLVVPVISTTFASVGTFLKDIPANEIAYLFIDEAGQAAPQTAAGALWRSRKAIVVGDPLQIEPIMAVHDQVTERLGSYYQQGDMVKSKFTSVQSFADYVNRIGGQRTLQERNDLWIGAPLTVHSRCQRRIFDISNEIAYNNKMIYATPGPLKENCCWIEVKGQALKGHYIPDQTERLKALVIRHFQEHLKVSRGRQQLPSLFIITPFRSVRDGLKKDLRAALEKELWGSLLGFDKRQLNRWIVMNIGTIHTFQGKEAESVIICLGAAQDEKGQGAARWASFRPNILNVAVTRARRNLYIVGDSAVWADKPYFAEAKARCDQW